MMKKEILVLAIVLGVVYFFPWKSISWGKITLSPERTVTVTGFAESKITNQVARFSAGVNAINDNKEAAVNEVNKKMTDLVAVVKSFGVEDADIQTSQVNVYQMQQSETKIGLQMMPAIDGDRVKMGQWSASNSVEITLKDVNKAGELTDILTKSGATNVYGPNFSLDTSNKASDKLIGAAIEDSKVKAEAVAVAGGAKLGKMISFNEGYTSNPGIYSMLAKTASDVSAPAPMEIGSTSVYKSVTVVWGLE